MIPCLRGFAHAAAFARDWVLVHEMTHLALPVVPRESGWLLEGSATYVEPIARAQAGHLAPAEVWREAIEGMPKGLPAAGDRGLDHTPTWGRTYWGGAIFCFLADVAIRQQTMNRYGLQDALRVINRESGGNGTQWPIAHVLAVGDAATGTHVLRHLYAKMKDAPTRVDLEGAFRELGIGQSAGQVVFDEKAPLAGTLGAIMRGSATTGTP